MNKQEKNAIFDALRPSDELIETVKARAAWQQAKPGRRPRPLIAAAVFAAVCLAALGVWRLFGNRTVSVEPTNAPTAQTPTAQTPTGFTEPQMPTNWYPPESIPRQADGSVRYGDISVDGRQGMSIPTASAMTSIASFSESMAKAGVLCFEGTVWETHFKHYSFLTYYGVKFGEDCKIRYQPVTQITTFRIERVWHGDPALVGTFITLEDEGGTEDAAFSYRLGVPYVVIVQKLNRPDVSAGHGETLLEGDNTRDSEFATLYPFQPQIERTRHGMYIVPASWESLTRGCETMVCLDESTLRSGDNSADFEFFQDKLRLVDHDLFTERMTELMQTDE